MCVPILWGDIQPGGFHSLVSLWNRIEREATAPRMKMFFFLFKICWWFSLSHLSLSASVFRFPSLSINSSSPSLAHPPSKTRVVFSARMFQQDALWACHGRPAKLHFISFWFGLFLTAPIGLSPPSAVSQWSSVAAQLGSATPAYWFGDSRPTTSLSVSSSIICCYIVLSVISKLLGLWSELNGSVKDSEFWFWLTL